MRFGEMLAAVRKDRGLTQTQLAERLGVTQGTVSDIERGDNVTEDTIRRYAGALGVDVRLEFGDAADDALSRAIYRAVRAHVSSAARKAHPPAGIPRRQWVAKRLHEELGHRADPDDFRSWFVAELPDIASVPEVADGLTSNPKGIRWRVMLALSAAAGR